MGPGKGFKRKRRLDQQVEGDSVLDSSQQHEPIFWWNNFSRRITRPLSVSNGLENFESVLNVSMKTFHYICSLVKEDLMVKSASFTCTNGKVLSINELVAIALRRLSSGESLLTVGEIFGINQSTVSQVTWRFVEAMEDRALPHLRWPTTEREMKEIKGKFHRMQGLPNCCGVIDTTHVMMCLPAVEPSNEIWFDSKKNHSMVLQAVVDSDMRFRDIVTGWPGCMKDFLVLKKSLLFEFCEKGKRLNGAKIELSEGSELGEYIIGDAGFPLLPWLVTPYRGIDLPDSEVDFNRRHLATRMVAQRAFARLKDMWKIVQGMMWRPDKNRLPRIILVCCLLHNIVIDMEDDVQDEMPLAHCHDVGYRQQVCQVVDADAFILRDKLSEHLAGQI